MDLSRLTTPQKVMAVAVPVVALAAFLPWVSIFGISVSGIRGDGMLTLLFAIAGGVLLAVRTGVLKGGDKLPARPADIALVVLGGLVALIGLMDMNGAAAIGLYLTLFGGVAWTVGAVMHLTASRAAATQTSGAPANE